MGSKRWVVAVAAALGCLLAPPSSFVSATIFGDWHPVGTQGGFHACTNASWCGENVLGLSFLEIDEISADQRNIPHAVTGLGNTQVFVYNYNYTTNWGNGSTSVTKWFSAAIPTNGINTPYALPALASDPTFTCNVTQLVSGAINHFGSATQVYNAPFTRGALQVDVDISHWTFASSANSLNMSMFITLNENAQMTGQAISSSLYSPKIMRFNLTKTVYLDVPLVALDQYGSEMAAWADVTGADGMYYLHVGLPANSRVKYTFLISGGGDIVVPTPAPTPMPSPTGTNTTTNSTIAPRNITIASRNITNTNTTLPRTAPQPKANASAFSTALNTFPGGFEFCVAPNCNIFDGSFSLTLDRMGSDAFLNSNDSELTFGFVTTDFSSSSDQLVFETLDNRSDTSSIGYNSSSDFQALLLSVPIGGGLATRLTTTEFNDRNDSDLVYLGLLLEHLVSPAALDDAYGSNITMAKGAVKMSLSIELPGFESAGMPSNNVTAPAISFFISAFQHGKMVTNVTVDRRQMFITRVILGDDMYLEFPYYTMVDGYSYPLDVGAKLHTSGEFQGLIQLSLLVSSTISYSFGYEAVISSATVDNGTSRTNEWAPPLPPTKVSNRDIKTQILTLSHGEFGLCFNTSSCDSSSVKMGFSGLGVRSSTSGSSGATTTQFDKFRNAAGFQFREPQLVVDGNVTKWSTGFRAFVPQSHMLPPFPYDASLASTASAGYPEFSVQVDQFLTHGQALNGDQKIKVPRGALKFAINMTKWTFAAVTDTLVLNVTLSDILGDGSASVPGALGFIETVNIGKNISRTLFDVATLVEFPLLAVVDGQMKAVDVTSSFDANNGLTFTLVFPYFAHTLYYDPVLSSLTLEADQVLDEAANRPPEDVNLRSHGPKSTKSDTIAIILLAFLAFVLIVSAARCAKRVSVNLDFSKLAV
ncbi:hypothetical protein Gpo141_00006782 [Globisporangium polare]